MTRREFTAKVKVAAFERANGQCEGCGAKLTVGKFDYDHVVPCGLGGEPTLDNCEVLCRPCHRGAGSKTSADVAQIAKAKRVRSKHINAASPTRNPLPGSKGSRWKAKIGGGWVDRETGETR